MSSIWAHSFSYKSATTELHERVDSKCKDLYAHYKIGVICLFLQFNNAKETICLLTWFKADASNLSRKKLKYEQCLARSKELNDSN